MTTKTVPPSSTSTRQIIQQAVCTGGQCSLDIVALLSDVFDIPSSTKPPSTSKTNQRPLAPTSKSKQQSLKNLGNAKTSKTQLSPSDKIKLATETVNNSLRTLTNLIKAGIVDIPEPTNIKTKAPAKTLVSQTIPKSKANGDDQGNGQAMNLADCCRLAVSYLYSLGVDDIKDLGALTIEAAHSTLVGKLVAVKRYELAAVELAKLRNRLIVILGLNCDKVSPETGGNQLNHLLKWTSVPEEATALNLVISCQLNALRLVSASNNSSQLEAILPILASTDSPAQVILSTASDNQSKAVRNLEICANTLLSCLSGSIGNDHENKNNLNISATTAFQVHLLACEFKILSLGLQHQDTQEKGYVNILDALQRYFMIYGRKFNANPQRQDYEKVAPRLKVIFSLLSRHASDVQSSSRQVQLLGVATDLAQDANLWKQAMEWIDQTAQVLQNENGANTLQYALTIRRVTIMIRGHIDKAYDCDQVKASMDKALSTMNTSFKGTAKDGERFFQEVLQLRRSVTLYLSQKSTDDSLLQPCHEIAYATITFLNRYSKASNLQKDPLKAIKLCSPSIDLVLNSLMNNFIVTDSACWEKTDYKLQECLNLASFFSDSVETGGETPAEAIFQKISNAYQHIGALYRKENLIQPAISAMRRCVSVLGDRPDVELIRGNYSAKLERLATYYYNAEDYGKAKDNLASALSALAHAGAFNHVGEGFANLEALDLRSGEFALTTKSLSLYIKCCTLSADTKVWDDSKINTDARGLILEWQLRSCLSLGTIEGRKLAQNCINSLLNVYAEDRPLRRARTIASYLSLAHDCPVLDIQKSAVGLGEEACVYLENKTGQLFEDSALRPQKDIIHGNILVNLGLVSYSQEQFQPELLRRGLELWKTAVTSCQDHHELLLCVNDLDSFQARLDLLSNFLEFKGYAMMRVIALTIIISLKTLNEADLDELVKYHTLLGVQYLRLGYSGKAGKHLISAQKWMENTNSVSTVVKLHWHLGYTEYLIGIGHNQQGEEIYAMTQELVDKDEKVLDAAKSGASQQARADINCLFSEALHVCSLLQLSKGDANDAYAYAKRSLRLIQKAWAGLEARSDRRKALEEEGLQRLTDGLSRLTTRTVETPPAVYSTTLDKLRGPALWPIIRLLYAALMQMTQIHKHQGLLREAEHYAVQALKTAEAVKAEPFTVHAKTVLGDLKYRGGAHEEGDKMLQEALHERDELLEQSKEIVVLDCSIGNMYHKIRSWDLELDAYEKAEKVLEGLISTDVAAKLDDNKEQSDLIASLENLKLEENVAKPLPRAGRGARATKLKAVSKPKPSSKASTKSETTNSASKECRSLLQMKGEILRYKAISLAMQSTDEAALEQAEDLPIDHDNQIARRLKLAETFLQQAQDTPCGEQEAVTQRLATTRTLLARAIKLIESDHKCSTLGKSFVAIPGIVTVPVHTSPVKPKSKTKVVGKAKSTNTKVVIQQSTRQPQFIALLTKARDQIQEVQLKSVKVCSTHMARSVASLINCINFLILSVSCDNLIQNPLAAIYSMELQRGLSLARERWNIDDEKADDKSLDSKWPVLNAELGRQLIQTNINDFQELYIDIIPPEWSVVSITLAGDNHDEMYFTRFRGGQSPFMLRAPLNRDNSPDFDDSDYSYDNVLSEMQELVADANETTHMAREMTTNGQRAEWWELRQNLDVKLKELLDKIEDNWLGGLKGIFGQFTPHKALQAKFRNTFVSVLDQHLPSRFGPKPKKFTPLQLESRVIDLCLGLGDPNDDELDISEAVEDYIYFIIDILTINGEDNPSDEIDIAAISVKLIDAIKTYHSSVKKQGAEDGVQHTILILDKSVHMFPWESLPCLKGRSVSRLPSLSTLRDRIIHAQEAAISGREIGYYADRDEGAYILNPAGDLKSTQKQFESKLEALDDWDGVVGKITSTEKEFSAQFKEFLAEKDIFAYFGHGSGYQYIRGRDIKQLDQCATTLLLGCRSGLLNDAGDFEPWGTPIDYIHAGCPSLVCTLWDVTDKDIDRFSKTVFEKWGLFETEPEVNEKKTKKTPLKMRNKNGKGGIEKPQKAVSLAAAVAKGRQSCHLEYLNGAATVVYGIPVFLG